MQGVNAKLITNPAMQGIDAAYPTFCEKRNSPKRLEIYPMGVYNRHTIQYTRQGYKKFRDSEKGGLKKWKI